jgi:hypothetical protein
MARKIDKIKLKDGTTGPFEPNDKVLYIPYHKLMGDRTEMIDENNLGIVTSKNDKFVFVKFLNKKNQKPLILMICTFYTAALIWLH